MAGVGRAVGADADCHKSDHSKVCQLHAMSGPAKGPGAARSIRTISMGRNNTHLGLQKALALRAA